MNQRENQFEVKDYTDTELFEILDLTNPSDRVLEAKIISMIKRYENAKTIQEKKFLQFFEDVYDHFFEDPQEDQDEEEQEDQEEQDQEDQEGFTSMLDNKGNIILEADKESLDTKDLEIIVEKSAKNPWATNAPNKKNKKDTTQTPTLVDSQSVEYRKGKLNPVLKETVKRIIQLDSQFRDTSVYPSSTDYTINLSDPLTDVVSLRLSSINIPQTWYTIGNEYGSNFFLITAVSPGISDVENNPFSYKIEIEPGNYVLSQGAPNDLIQNINNSIADISNQNPEINFGSTSLSYDTINGKATFTLDINGIFSEVYYELYFPNTSDPFSTDSSRNITIPGILGFLNNTYANETIYSDFTSAYLITRQSDTEPISDESYTNGFVNQQPYGDIIVDDPENEIQGNNYFTIYNYVDTDYSSTTNNKSPNIFDTSDNNPAIQILDEIKVIFIDIPGTYTRDYITEKINTALKGATTENSSFTLEDISFVYTSDSELIPYGDPLRPYNRMQRYKMYIELDRTKIHNQVNMKQAVVFPPDSTYPRVLYGSESLFLFESTISKMNELSNTIPEAPISQYSYEITSSPYIILRCMKPDIISKPNFPYDGPSNYYYDTSYNNFKIDIPKDSYTLDEYLRLQITEAGLLRLPPIDPEYSENQEYSFKVNEDHQKMFYDTDILRTRLQLSMLKNYDQTAYILDLSQCYLHTVLGLPAQIDTTDNNESGVMFYSTFTDEGNYTINNSNRYFTITPKSTALGLQNIPPFKGVLRETEYPNLSEVQIGIQNTINTIQGLQDENGTLLNGLSLLGTFITIERKYLEIDINNIEDPSHNIYNVSFNYDINNIITEKDYQIEFYDDASYNESTQTSWAYYLGFSDQSYNLKETEFYHEIISENDIIGFGINISTNNNNNIFYINAINSKVGVYSRTEANNIKITIPSKRYSLPELMKEINNQFDMNPLTKGSTVSTYNDGFAKEHSIFRLNINKIYTAQDYTLTFFDQNQFTSCSVGGQGIYSIKTSLWDSTVGWILGFHSNPVYNFSTAASNQENIANYKKYNAYNINLNSINQPIVSLTGDATVNIYLFNQFYIILDDYTQNHLNDGVVTVTTSDKDIALPSYANRANFRCNPSNDQQSVSLYRSDYDGSIPQLLTRNQVYAATQILTNQQTNATKSIYSPPPYVKDMFAVIAMKLTSLQVGQSFVEYGGSLQDHDRKYFGPVNIRRMTIRLLTDRGNVVDLNGANWSFSMICEQLYSSNRE